MCGIVGYVGKVEPSLLAKIVWESSVRGLHNLGSHFKDDAGMFHWRYKTSGEDNQPLFVDGKCMAFNGVIDMGTKDEIEKKYSITMTSDNDGEILLRLCSSYPEAVEFLRSSSATFAGIWMEGNTLTAIRNEGRPLWKYEKEGKVLLASTKDIFNRSGVHDVTPLEPLKIYQWTF